MTPTPEGTHVSSISFKPDLSFGDNDDMLDNKTVTIQGYPCDSTFATEFLLVSGDGRYFVFQTTKADLTDALQAGDVPGSLKAW